MRKDKTYKTCCSCGEHKTLGDFYNSKASKDGKTNKCKDCAKAYSREYKKLHKEEVQKYARRKSREYYYGNRTERLEKQKEYRKRNLEKRRAYDKVQSKRHYRENPEVYIEKSARRRANKVRATPPWVDADHRKRLTSIYKACRNITKRSGTKHHVDHVIPLQGENVCGLHVWWNLRIVPARVNLSKGNRYEHP